MENGCQVKCGAEVTSSTDMAASPVTATNALPLEMNMNSDPTNSNILKFGSRKYVHHDIGNSFFSLLSAPPSFLQGDLHLQSNLKSSVGRYYPNNFTSNNAEKLPQWSIVPNNGNSNSTPVVDVLPVSQSTPTMNISKNIIHGLPDDPDAPRKLAACAGSRNENSGNASLHKAIDCASPHSVNGRMSHDSESNMMLQGFLQLPSTDARNQTISGCPRVFCMGACGNLLLSNTGLLGIHCSCHGHRMSVSNFCQHSGLSDVNPGNAVHMESGESIAQWRKLYLQKFGIRAPEDDRGWDWPEGFLTTPGLESTTVPSKSRVFDLSGLFTTSAEPIKPAQPWSSVSTSKPQSVYESKVEQEIGHNHCSFFMSCTGIFQRNLHSLTDNPTKNSRVSRRGLSSDCQSRAFHSKIISGSENSSSFGFLNLQRVGFTTDNSSKEYTVLQRGKHSSRTELKLEQPNQQGWGSGSSTLLAMRSNVKDMNKTTLEDQATHSPGSSKVIKNCEQYLHWNLPSALHSNKKESHGGPQSDDFFAAKGASQAENYRDINSYHFIPQIVHSQPHVDRSALTHFSCNEGGRPISALEANKLAFQQNRDCTLNEKCEINHSIVGGETSFRFYVKQMEKSGFFSTNGNNSQFSSTVPSEKFNRHQTDSMRPGVTSASKYEDNVCSLGSYSNHIISSQEFGITQTLSRSSSSFTPVAGLNPDSLKKVDHVTPHRSDGSFTALASRNPIKPLTEKVVDASFRVNKRMRSDAKEVQRSKNCSVSDSWIQGSFLDQGPSKGIFEHPFNLGHNAKSTFLPDNGCVKADNSRIVTKQAGTNNWEDLEGGSCYVVSNSEVSDKCVHGSCGCQLARHPSLSPCRGENNASGCNMLQGCSEESCTYSSATSHSKLRKIYSNRESDSKGICVNNTLKKQTRMEFVRGPELSGSKAANGSLPILQVSLRDCNRKAREQPDDQLDCPSSQWRDVPSKVHPVAQLRCPNAADKKSEANFQVEEFGANASSTSDRVSDLKGKESSNVSSGCSEPVVTHASFEATKTGSYTVDGGDSGYTNDQIADQGSTVDRSWSSADAMDSVKSSQSVFCGEGKPTEEESLTVLPDVAIHCLNHKYKQKHSTATELLSLGESEARFGNVCNTTLNQNNLSNFRKRKHKAEGRTLGTSLAIEDVSSSPSESPTCASICDADNAYTSEDIQVLLQSSQDSVNTVGTALEAHVAKRRRPSMSSVKIPCKRDLSGMYSVNKAEIGDRRSLKGNDECLAVPENVVSKRLKQEKPTESLVRQATCAGAAEQFCFSDPDSDESSKCNCCQKTPCVCDQNVGIQKAKPVARGKYGILCTQECDIDKIKPPKIVPLSHVLKSARRLAECNNAGQDSQCNDFSSCTDGDHSTNANETLKTYHKGDKIVASDLSVLDDIEASGNKRNLLVSSGAVITKSKPKGTHVLSPCELSMRECESERKEFGDSGKNDCDHCKSGINGDGGQSPCSSLVTELDALCCVCGVSSTDETNCLLECSHCLIRIHQACYGISRVPKGDWYCRPCRTSSKDVACVLCGYGGGAMTRAFGSRNIIKSLLKAWNIPSKSHTMRLETVKGSYAAKMKCKIKAGNARFHLASGKSRIHNSITSGLFDRTVKQWVHMVCGLWTPGSRCPNASTMSAFDVSGVSHPKLLMVCYMCKRRGGSCIRCCVDTCNTYFHPWCAHQKGLLTRKDEDGDDHDINFYGRCLLHADHQINALEGNSNTHKNDSETEQGKESTCARTEVYKGKTQECEKHKGGSYVSQVQLDAWLYINRRKMNVKRLLTPPVSDADYDYRKEYARYKQAKGWKQLIVYKSGIHGFGLYSSVFIPHGAMVVEYIGEIVGLHVADKREMEYLSGRRVQYKGACYFFKIDKEHIIDATYKGGIARFVNHSCQPNCAAKVIAIRGEKKVVFFAERDIYPGQEVTYDYHFNHEDEGKKIPCFCNSKKCKRFLN